MTRGSRAELLDAALRYAGHGWPVFPCKPGAKEPATKHGLLNATTDEQQIRTWWNPSGPRFNVAIATGAPGPDVLDIDVKAADGRQALSRLAQAGLIAGACAMIRTRSGGLHVYYQGTGQRNGSLRAHGVDFRSSGGYVLAPPSWVDADRDGQAGRYAVLEKRPAAGRIDWDAVKKLLSPAQAQPVTQPRQASGDGQMTEAARAGILRTVTDANESGGWAGALYWAGCRYGEAAVPLADTLADLLAAARPWDAREARRAEMHARNGWQRGQGVAS